MTRRCALLLHFLQLIIVLKASQNNFVEPYKEFLGVEYYEYEGERYAIYTQRVTWEEANQLCPARNGTLIDYETPGLAEFIARALAESAVGFGALWINGKFVKADKALPAGEWMWPRSGNPISVDVSAVSEFPMNVTPYWVDKPPAESPTELCLGTDRRLHHLPLIVPVECKQNRPYICKLPAITDGGQPTEVRPPVDAITKRYHVFQGSVTWAEALAQCRLYNMKLAKLTKLADFVKIGHKMLRIRPVMENAWIGGSYTDNKWTWVSTDEPILVDAANQTDSERFAWYRPDNIIPEGCLLADRHVCDHFVYVEAKCDRRRPFICEQDIGIRVTPPFVKVTGTIWISTFIETWIRAQYTCLKCFNGQLLQIQPPTKEEVEKYLPALYTAMALSIGIEIRHVWIGGYLFGEKFKWTATNEKEPEGDDLALDAVKYGSTTYGIGDKGILVYCNVSLSVETYLLKYKCLNMDRENQKNFFMYGLNCDLKQYFICQAAADVKEMLACDTGFAGIAGITAQPGKPTTDSGDDKAKKEPE